MERLHDGIDMTGIRNRLHQAFQGFEISFFCYEVDLAFSVSSYYVEVPWDEFSLQKY